MATGAALWDELEQLLRDNADERAAELREELSALRALWAEDAAEARSELALVRLRLLEDSEAIHARCAALQSRVEPWVEESTDRLKATTRQFFEAARDAIRRDLDEAVGYGTPWKEALEGVSKGISDWNKTRTFKNEVDAFFEEREDDAAARAALVACRAEVAAVGLLRGQPGKLRRLAGEQTEGAPEDAELRALDEAQRQRLCELGEHYLRVLEQIRTVSQAAAEEYRAGKVSRALEPALRQSAREVRTRLREMLQHRAGQVKAEIKSIRSAGKARFEELDRKGFFDAHPHERLSILRGFDARLVDAFLRKGWVRQEPSAEEAEPPAGVLARILDRHLGSARFDEFTKAFLTAELEHFRRYWELVFREAGVSEKEWLALSRDREERLQRPEAQIGGDVIAVNVAVGTPLVAAAVLAAGWHTWPWALSHLFFPLMLITMPIAIWRAWAAKDNTLEEMTKNANLFCERLLTKQLETIDAVYVEKTRGAARQSIDAYRTVALQQRTGLPSWTRLRKLEALLVKLLEETSDAERVDCGADFLALAREQLENGHAHAAAALAVSAYQQVLDGWLVALGVRRAAGPDELRRTIDLLMQHPEADRASLVRLSRLRRVRNRWAHGMRDLATIPAESASRRVADFLDSLTTAAPPGSPGATA